MNGMSTGSLPKYLVISREIESQILAGGWTDGRVPSSREIAESRNVSLVTASRALQVLRDKGLIRTVERSGSFLATPKPSRANGSKARCAVFLRSTPGPWQQASIASMRAAFSSEARQDDIELSHDALEIRDGIAPSELKQQARRAAAAGITGVFFMPSRLSDESARLDEAFVDACQSAGLVVVQIERNLRGRWRPLACDLAATDDLDGGFRCTEHLIAQGRRRIAFITGSPTSSHEGRIAGYLAALQQAETGSSGRRDSLLLEQRAGLATKAAYEELADRVLKLKADGVVCYQDYTAIGLIMELLTRGSRVPRDVAITGFDNLPIGNSFALGVTTYAFPSEAVAQQSFRIMRWRLETPSAPKIKVLVPGELIVRESSAGGCADQLRGQ
jgi:LacI family transcriptional regulator